MDQFKNWEKPALIGMNCQELATLLNGEPAFRSKQLYEFLYSHRSQLLSSIMECSVLSLNLRKKLYQEYRLFSTSMDCKIRDGQGVVKYRILLPEGDPIEAVVLVDGKGRRTACLSSQSGCRMGCTFCRTAKLGFGRNLTAGEILEQLKWIESDSGEISNIVFMGMGEPLDNIENVLKAVSIITDERGFGLGRRRITLSTCGIGDGIDLLGEASTGIRLALSLNNAINEEREEIMPITKRWSLIGLKASLLSYQQKCAGKRITLEYVMLEGQNMTKEHATAIAHFAKGLKVLINLIPLNGSPDLPFNVPSDKICQQFELWLSDMGLNVTRRYSKGGSIEGACGQLAGKTLSL